MDGEDVVSRWPRGASRGGDQESARARLGGAERIIAASQGGSSRRDLARTFKLSESTIKAILKHWREHGVARVPRQGQGKKDDPRWVFAGRGVCAAPGDRHVPPIAYE